MVDDQLESAVHNKYRIPVRPNKTMSVPRRSGQGGQRERPRTDEIPVVQSDNVVLVGTSRPDTSRTATEVDRPSPPEDDQRYAWKDFITNEPVVHQILESVGYDIWIDIPEPNAAMDGTGWLKNKFKIEKDVRGEPQIRFQHTHSPTGEESTYVLRSELTISDNTLTKALYNQNGEREDYMVLLSEGHVTPPKKYGNQPDGGIHDTILDLRKSASDALDIMKRHMK